MKKKFLTVLLAIIAAFSLCFGLAACGETPRQPEQSEQPGQSVDGGMGDGTEAEKSTEGLQYQKRRDDQGGEYFAVVGLGTSEDIEIVIPAAHDSLPVKEIGDKAFSSSMDARNASLASMTIPDSVTTIAQEAFNGCKGLKSVTIGSSVTSIGEDVFDMVRDTTEKSKILSKQPLSRA